MLICRYIVAALTYKCTCKYTCVHAQVPVNTHNLTTIRAEKNGLSVCLCLLNCVYNALH